MRELCVKKLFGTFFFFFSTLSYILMLYRLFRLKYGMKMKNKDEEKLYRCIHNATIEMGCVTRDTYIYIRTLCRNWNHVVWKCYFQTCLYNLEVLYIVRKEKKTLLRKVIDWI